ncbi:MAG: GNAT family N-acetyltransferase [Proteobacteria bacterium]|nr:MAG: GNAT family N-acetyltransferase [Pseudomonadota bacterium]
MHIRTAKESDVPRVAPLFNAYREFYGQNSDLDGARDCISDNLNLGRSTIFVSEEEGEAVGFTQLYPAFCSVEMKPFYVLYDLFVSPNHRTKGIGSALLNHAHAWAKSQGAFRVVLETAHTNTTAQSVYEGLGYEMETEFRKYSFSTE